MHYNTRTGVGNFSSSCNYSVDNLASIPSAEYSVILQREHEDYVELAWKSNGVAFDLNYFDKNTDYCPVLIDAVIQYAGVKDFPCTLDSKLYFTYYRSSLEMVPQIYAEALGTVIAVPGGP